MSGLRIWPIAILLLSASASAAGGECFECHAASAVASQQRELDALHSAISWTQTPVIGGRDKFFDVSASASFARSPEKLLATAVDYEAYPRLPGLEASILDAKIVSSSARTGKMIVWFKTTAKGQSASYYVEVARSINADKSAAELSWTLLPDHPSSPYPNSDSVKRLDGSWKLTRNPSTGLTDVVYSLKFEPKTSRLVPASFVRMALSGNFRGDITSLFQALTR